MAVSRADEEAWQRLENAWQAAAQSLTRRLQAITGKETQERERKEEKGDDLVADYRTPPCVLFTLFLLDTQSLSLQQSLLSEAHQDATDTQAAIEAIESEMRHFPYSLRNRAQKAVVSHTADLERAQSMLRRYDASVSRGQVAGVSHMDLVARLGNEEQQRYYDQRQQLLSGSQMISESDQSLSRTQQVLLETAEIGAATSSQLIQQREQFQNQINTVHETDDFISRSKRTLQRMHRRLVTNKILQGAIILVQMGAVGLILYLKYYN